MPFKIQNVYTSLLTIDNDLVLLEDKTLSTTA